MSTFRLFDIIRRFYRWKSELKILEQMRTKFSSERKKLRLKNANFDSLDHLDSLKVSVE